MIKLKKFRGEIMGNNSGCCSGNSTCCGSEKKKEQGIEQTKKKLIIDFLFLDLTVCERCQGAETNLERAVDEVSAVLNAAGYEVVVNKVNVNTKELAIKHRFISSPTIRIDGSDIALEVKESVCKDCGDLCGDGNVECRVWVYEGSEYNEPPKEMIVNAILKKVYGEKKSAVQRMKKYELPENLKVFFEGQEKKNSNQ